MQKATLSMVSMRVAESGIEGEGVGMSAIVLTFALVGCWVSVTTFPVRESDDGAFDPRRTMAMVTAAKATMMTIAIM